ncbi:inactive protein RESTRICTED TEV MOVEMENT 2-like protein [Carex littledalei]|uniref:Inactive protein RESTRICTED TEV MOVEMENT 2-like protein n=1 Tax=Carex littledalei TaxID=544730 RepID=A0A833QJ54_9POAL|nr:inactive protein RESTRICTED TEV MOVEMENT 2-like protein [Carex littledalei]
MHAGFEKEQIRVLIDKSGKLNVIGERPLVEFKWIRFRKEFEIPENCNKTEIRAKFEKGHVYITLPKHVVDLVPPPKDQATQTTTQDKKATEPKLSSTDQTGHSKKANENEQREEKRSDPPPVDAQNKVEDKKADRSNNDSKSTDQATQTTTEDKKATEPKLPSTDQNGHSRKANSDLRENKRSDPPLVDAQNKVIETLQKANLESSNLIIGIDFTKSNEWKHQQKTKMCSAFIKTAGIAMGLLKFRHDIGSLYLIRSCLLIFTILCSLPKDFWRRARPLCIELTDPLCKGECFLPGTNSGKGDRGRSGSVVRETLRDIPTIMSGKKLSEDELHAR